MNQPKQPIPINQIQWDKVKYMAGGGFAAIFKVNDHQVLKIGLVDKKEARLQKFFAKKNLALPVWDYQPQITLPKQIHRKACPIHGPRKHFCLEDATCLCKSPIDVLSMPMARPSTNKEEEEALAETIAELQKNHPEQHRWDERPANYAKYHRRTIALDFGNEANPI